MRRPVVGERMLAVYRRRLTQAVAEGPTADEADQLDELDEIDALEDDETSLTAPVAGPGRAGAQAPNEE